MNAGVMLQYVSPKNECMAGLKRVLLELDVGSFRLGCFAGNRKSCWETWTLQVLVFAAPDTFKEHMSLRTTIPEPCGPGAPNTGTFPKP